MEIISKNNIRIKEILKLTPNNSNMFLIEGFHLVEEAYKSNLVQTIFTTVPSQFTSYEKVEIVSVSYDVILKISKTKTPQKVVALCNKPPKVSISYNKNLVLLDNLQDPGNVGTIIRTAAAFNYGAVITSPTTVNLYNDKVIRSSQGAIFKVAVMSVELREFIKNLISQNYIIIAATLNVKSINFLDFKINAKYAIIFGSEGSGVSSELIDLADHSVMIPLSNDVESLNVATAAAICMYQLAFK